MLLFNVFSFSSIKGHQNSFTFYTATCSRIGHGQTVGHLRIALPATSVSLFFVVVLVGWTSFGAPVFILSFEMSLDPVGLDIARIVIDRPTRCSA